MKSFDQTTINLKVSSVVFKGSRLMRTEQGPEVNAPAGACGVLAPLSFAKAFIAVIDRDWYVCCVPLEGRKAWPGWENTGGFMACCGVKDLARSNASRYWCCENSAAVSALDGLWTRLVPYLVVQSFWTKLRQMRRGRIFERASSGLAGRGDDNVQS